MARQFQDINDTLRRFIEAQKIYFVGTAAADGRVNLSPKGLDSLRILSPTQVIWLNLTGSGNETAAHIQENSRMTLMLTAFDGPPMILRIYGTARVVHLQDADWEQLYSHFEPNIGARQIFDLSVDLVQTSCGYAVPLFDYVGDRDVLDGWTDRKGPEGIQKYWEDHNQVSIDGKPTNIMQKNLGSTFTGKAK